MHFLIQQNKKVKATHKVLTKVNCLILYLYKSQALTRFFWFGILNK